MVVLEIRDDVRERNELSKFEENRIRGGCCGWLSRYGSRVRTSH